MKDHEKSWKISTIPLIPSLIFIVHPTAGHVICPSSNISSYEAGPSSIRRFRDVDLTRNMKKPGLRWHDSLTRVQKDGAQKGIHNSTITYATYINCKASTITCINLSTYNFCFTYIELYRFSWRRTFWEFLMFLRLKHLETWPCNLSKSRNIQELSRDQELWVEGKNISSIKPTQWVQYGPINPQILSIFRAGIFETYRDWSRYCPGQAWTTRCRWCPDPPRCTGCQSGPWQPWLRMWCETWCETWCEGRQIHGDHAICCRPAVDVIRSETHVMSNQRTAMMSWKRKKHQNAIAILPTSAYQASFEKEEVEELYSHGMSWDVGTSKSSQSHAMPPGGYEKRTIKASHGIPIAARCCKMLQKLKSLNGLHGIHSKRL